MHKSRNPSFSSTLLDEIYNSIDPKTHKTQSFSSLHNPSKKQSITVTKSIPDRKIYFGSVSSSSDSSSSIFSSSDTELTHGKKPPSSSSSSSSSSRPLCFGPSKPKPRKTEEKTLFHQNRANRVHDDYDYASDVPKITRYDENWGDTRVRRSTKSKKPKTPASPAGRIVNFLNSLFTNNNSKQSNAVKSRKMSYDDSAYVKKQNDYYHPSTCSSASSFSRSCMNKGIEKSSDRIKPSVRFSPVNFIVPEESEFDGYVRKSVKKNVEDGGRRSVEEIAREFLRDYHNKNLKVKDNEFEDYEEDDDVASDSSSDLFELDLVGNHNHNHVYGDELPVYETTFAGLIL